VRFSRTQIIRKTILKNREFLGKNRELIDQNSPGRLNALWITALLTLQYLHASGLRRTA